MHFQISLQDGVPIYRQIVNQVKYMVAAGKLQPEDELPPMRALAKQLLVTPNTIVKAYGELESAGVIYKRRGAGTYVSRQGSPLARREQRRILVERVDGLLSEARQMDFSFEEVIQLLRSRQLELQKSAAEDESDVGKCG